MILSKNCFVRIYLLQICLVSGEARSRPRGLQSLPLPLAKYLENLTQNCQRLNIHFGLHLLVRVGSLMGMGNSSTGFHILAVLFFQIALKSTKFDPNGVKMAFFYEKSLKSVIRELHQFVPHVAKLRHFSSKRI